MKRKYLAFTLAMIMVSSTIIGCGSSASSSEASTEPAAEEGAEEEAPAEGEEESADDSGKTEITFYKQDGGNGAVEALIEAFEASQDKYTVNWVIAPKDSGDVKSQMITSFQAGSSDYDVVCIDTVWAGDLAGAGYLEALDTHLMDAGLTAADFNAGSMQAGTYNAKSYAVPLFPDFGCLYFRNDIVSAEDSAKLVAGDYTFEDLLAMAEKYKGQGGTEYGLTYQSAQYEGLICNSNEWTSNFTDISHGLELMKTAADSDYTPEDILLYKEEDCNNALINGTTVFDRGWPGAWGLLTDETTVKADQVDIAPLPGGSCIGGWLLAINSNSENKEGAWEFLKYAATEGQDAFCSTGGYVPGYNDYLTNENILANNELLSKPGFLKALENTIARPSSGNYAELSDALQISIHKYLSDEADLDSTATEVQSLLDQYQ
ncbi:MAG: extracellular solute-binding protein [Lachnospiraceae bacterium]|nr:extracellular solute-binding protein [Lachnospiraceae bacterium]MDD3615617.1 extracellular solute-binding protein [Lachnospiraceae bacterium]